MPASQWMRRSPRSGLNKVLGPWIKSFQVQKSLTVESSYGIENEMRSILASFCNSGKAAPSDAKVQNLIGTVITGRIVECGTWLQWY